MAGKPNGNGNARVKKLACNERAAHLLREVMRCRARGIRGFEKAPIPLYKGLGISETQARRYLNGDCQVPIRLREKLAAWLGISIEQLDSLATGDYATLETKTRPCVFIGGGGIRGALGVAWALCGLPEAERDYIEALVSIMFDRSMRLETFDYEAAGKAMFSERLGYVPGTIKDNTTVLDADVYSCVVSELAYRFLMTADGPSLLEALRQIDPSAAERFECDPDGL